MTPPGESSLLPVPPPKQLGRYAVGAKIGGGGMATVYIGHATRDDGSEERVALKVIRDELAHDEQFRSMFVDEAKILAQLSHPNVIRTLEYGVTGHHRFIAMELLSGRTYADLWDMMAARGEAIPFRLGAWICARVADGLHSAHELVDETGTPLSVIHRDVNPGNIFLTHAGEVKLIDFGLAKARVRLSKSEDGIVKGKIPYLAPEQAKGRPLDRRTDVYALGVTLWETVTMKRLFKRDTDVATLLAIREAFVPDVRTMIAGFPEDLWTIIARALSVDPDDRYATMDEVKAQLDAFVGSVTEMEASLAQLLARLFPGQEERQAQWEVAAASARVPMHTMPPPVPVPIASSSLLEGTDAPPLSVKAINDAARDLVEGARDAAASSAAPEIPANDERPATTRSAAASRSTADAPGGPRPRSRTTRSAPRGATAGASPYAAAADPDGPRRMAISLAIVVAIVAAVGFAVSAR